MSGRPWTTEDRETVRQLKAAGYSARQIAGMMSRSRNAVCGLWHRLDLADIRADANKRPAWTEKDSTTLRRLWHSSFTIVEIAAMMGAGDRTIRYQSVRLGLGPKKQVQPKSKPRRVTVPGWVPANMANDYTEIAKLEGEEAAASWARAEKRAMAA